MGGGGTRNTENSCLTWSHFVLSVFLLRSQFVLQFVLILFSLGSHFVLTVFSLGLTVFSRCFHLVITWFLLGSHFVLNCSHFVLTWSHFVLTLFSCCFNLFSTLSSRCSELNFTQFVLTWFSRCSHLVLTLVFHNHPREKGKPFVIKGKRENSAGPKGKGKGPATGFELDFHSTTTPRARTHERTKRNETISRLVSLPPTSDIYIYIYIYMYKPLNPIPTWGC